MMVQAIEDVVIPAIENMEARLRRDLASKKDIKDLAESFDKLDHKFDNLEARQDRQGQKIETLEHHVHFAAS